MVQERRQMFRVWNLFLVILMYALTVLGTFLTRAGLVSSVHAFAQSDIGGYFLVYTTAVTLGAFALLASRLGDLKDGASIETVWSRETAFLANNVFLLGALFAVLLGTLWPLVYEGLRDERVTVGAPYFNVITMPIFWVVILLMAVGPLVGWRRSDPVRLGRSMLRPFIASAAIVIALYALGVRHWIAVVGFGTCLFALLVTLVEIWQGVAARRARGEGAATALANLFARNRRRYGGYVVHIGVIVLAVGVIGSNVYQLEAEGSLAPGEALEIGRYSVTFLGVSATDEPDRRTLSAHLRVAEGGRVIGESAPSRQVFRLREEQPQTIPGVLSRPLYDVYALLGAYDAETGAATFKLYVNPLIAAVWLGMLVVVAGTLIAAWPDGAEERVMNAELRRLLPHRRALPAA
jgi:cytochrome c-type biogenesis protein CcmF